MLCPQKMPSDINPPPPQLRASAFIKCILHTLKIKRHNPNRGYHGLYQGKRGLFWFCNAGAGPMAIEAKKAEIFFWRKKELERLSEGSGSDPEAYFSMVDTIFDRYKWLECNV
ncbi:UNVERIFIED_CONTAM: hypothetical protein K2H54_028317 [Gekko kuhli]